MLKATYMLPLLTGELVSYEQILSPFSIYTAPSRNSFILIPKQDQQGLSDIIIVANAHGIRILHSKGWLSRLYSNIHAAIACKGSKFITPTCVEKVPTETLGVICEQLVKSITYNSENHYNI